MKVILLQDEPKLGKKGEVVEVKNGYAVNFLIPKSVAAVATDEVIANAKKVTEKRKKEEEQVKDFVSNFVSKVKGKTVQMKVKTSSGGRVYGSVSKEEVEKFLLKNWKLSGSGVSIQTDLAQPVREAGKYPIDVELKSKGASGKASIILEVVGQ